VSYKKFKEGGIIKPDGNYTIELPKGVEFNSELCNQMINDILMIGHKPREIERLKNLLTACYNCETMKEVKKLIEAEITREGV